MLTRVNFKLWFSKKLDQKFDIHIYFRELDSDYRNLLEQSLKNITMDLDGVIR